MGKYVIGGKGLSKNRGFGKFVEFGVMDFGDEEKPLR
jgi:hypothetical protein